MTNKANLAPSSLARGLTESASSRPQFPNPTRMQGHGRPRPPDTPAEGRSRPTLKSQIEKGIYVSAKFVGLRVRIQREIQTHGNDDVLWAVSFEGTFTSAKDSDYAIKFRRKRLDSSHVNRQGADEIRATSFGFWEGKPGPEFTHELLICRLPLRTNLIILAPKTF